MSVETPRALSKAARALTPNELIREVSQSLVVAALVSIGMWQALSL